MYSLYSSSSPLIFVVVYRCSEVNLDNSVYLLDSVSRLDNNVALLDPASLRESVPRLDSVSRRDSVSSIGSSMTLSYYIVTFLSAGC